MSTSRINWFEPLSSESRISEPSICQPAEAESLCVGPAAFEWKPHLRAKHMGMSQNRGAIALSAPSPSFLTKKSELGALLFWDIPICQPAKSLCWASSFRVKAASQSLPTNHWTMPNPKSTETPKLEENFFIVLSYRTSYVSYIPLIPTISANAIRYYTTRFTH